MKIKWNLFVSFLAAALVLSAQGDDYWDGGAFTGNWGDDANWGDDSAPAFDGTESITVTAGFVSSGTNLILGADRSVARITFGGGATTVNLGTSGETLTLTRTTSAAGNTTALWSANGNDSAQQKVFANVKLEAGAAGDYTGYFRETVNAGGGTYFYGAFSQGTDENWTLRFSQSSSRGRFVLANAANSVFALRNDGTELLSLTPGAFGNASITLNGGGVGTGGNGVQQHFTGGDAIANNLTLVANSTLTVGTATRFTGTLTQGGSQVTYSGGALAGADYASVSGSGATIVLNASLALLGGMDRLSSGTLSLGNSSTAGSGVLILRGSAGNDVPTWADFIAARTYNQSGGANTWRIDTPTGGNGGGFAARGANLVIPHQDAGDAGGMTSTTFARNFMLGSTATLDGSRYANHGVIINTDIDLTGLTPTYWSPRFAHNADSVFSTTSWTFGGPVHELNGVITEKTGGMIVIPTRPTGNQGAFVRITNPGNDLSDSRWILLGNRNAWVTPGGFSMGALGNAYDNSGASLIFTSDAAFGNALEVSAGGNGSSGGGNASFVFFEDTNAVSSTVFTRNIYVSNSWGTAVGGFGSWGGDVVYEGTATIRGSQGTAIAVREGTLSLGSGSTAANLTGETATTIELRKAGDGTLSLANATVGGSSAMNWVVYAGALRENGANSADSGVDRNVSLRGGVLEFGADPRTLTLGTGNGLINMSAGGGGGFSAFGGNRAVSLNSGANMTWASTANFVGNGQALILGSRTANAVLDFQNNLNLNGSVRTILLVDNAAATGDRGLISGIVSGTGSSGLYLKGDGILELSNNNTYAGNTTVSTGATLIVSGQVVGNVTVQTNATLGGAGAILASVTGEDGAIFRPGNSPGTLTVNTLTIGNSSYFWELGNDASTYDRIVAGSMGFSGVPTLAFYLGSAGTYSPMATDTFNLFTSFSDPGQAGVAYSYSLTSDDFNVSGASLQTVDAGGVYYIQLTGLTPVPEPGTLALLGLGGALAAWRRRKAR